MGLHSRKIFSKGKRGWPGDIPKYSLDNTKVKMLGWQPAYNSRKALKKAVRDLLCK